MDRCESQGEMRQFRALDLYCGAGGATKGLQRAGFHVTGVDIKPQKRYCGDSFIEADALSFLDWPDQCDFIWASPPCQAHSALRSLHPGREYLDLIPETRRRLVESGIPYVIENVPGAPLGETGCLIMLCATMFGLQTKDGTGEVRRHRLFECSFSIPLRPACQHNQPVVGVYGGHVRDRRRDVICIGGGKAMSGGMMAPKGATHRETMSVTGNGMGQMGGGRDVISICGHSGPGTFSSKGQRRRTWTTEQAREAMGIDWMPMSSLSQAVPPAYSEWIGRKAIEFLEASNG